MNQSVTLDPASAANLDALRAPLTQCFEQQRAAYLADTYPSLEQRRHDLEVECEAPVFDQRIVTDSGGHKEERYVIRTTITLGHDQWPIEMTLTDRDDMRFRMLLGRSAMKERLIVDPSQSYLVRKPRKHLR